jgi:hypothetical protein
MIFSQFQIHCPAFPLKLGNQLQRASALNVRSDEAQPRMDLGLSALPEIYRSISTSLRRRKTQEHVDGGEAAGLPHALLLVFLRGNADLAGLARASERVSVAERRNSGRGCWLGVQSKREGQEVMILDSGFWVQPNIGLKPRRPKPLHLPVIWLRHS